MAQSLFSFNTLSIPLSAPPPLSTQIIYLSSYIQGVTRAQIDYTKLFFSNNITFSAIKPFKVELVWGDGSETIVNDTYVYDSINDPLSTFSPFNSAASYHVYVPKSPYTELNATFTIYYENGIKHYHQNTVYLLSDNTIDLNLGLTDLQFISDKEYNVYNFSSTKGGMLYNNIDLG